MHSIINIGLNFLMVFFAPSRAANSLPSTSNLIAICLCCDSLSKSSRVTLGIFASYSALFGFPFAASMNTGFY